MKKAAKYLILVLAAITANFLLWKIGFDCLSNKVNNKSNQSVLQALVLMGIFALIVMGVFRWILGLLSFVPKTRRSKLTSAVIAIALIFGNTTFLNLKNLFSRVFTNVTERIELCAKINDANYLAYGTTAEKLTIKEYNQIRNLINLPQISNKSYDISYLYSYDGFLPDYTLEVSYKLPKKIKVRIYSEGEFDYGDGQTMEEFENYNLVHYSEYNR